MYYLLMPTLADRTNFISHLKGKGISAVFHYLPLNQSDFARGKSDAASRNHWPTLICPVTESISDRLVRLPFYTSMTPEIQGKVIEEIANFS